MAFFGDGATSQGDVHEAFVWSPVYDSPLVFYCQNNQWAISEPLERQTRIPLYRRAQGYGFPGVRVDGNDVLACLAVSRWALDECRSGNGPVPDRGLTYRMDAHTTSDDPTRYRLAGELELWKLKDPIEGTGPGLLRPHRPGRAGALLRCAAMPQPPAERTSPRSMRSPRPRGLPQRAEFLAYRAGFEPTG